MSGRYYTEIVSDCPVCGARRSFIVRQTVYNMPLEGPTVVASAKCLKCGYRTHWITPYEEGRERRLRYHVRGPRDLNAILVVGENTDVLIPEMGLEFLSSELEQGYVTTIEGVLERFRAKAEASCRGREEDRECRRRLREIGEALEGRRSFTVELVDRHGRSRIIEPGEPIE